MEQNRLKELILSIRNNKHRLEEKVSDLALAIEDKGTVDADTHELAELIKDAFTKRRKKEVYADLLSSIIGEPTNAPASTTPAQPSEQPAAEAPTFRSSVTHYDTQTDSMTVTVGNWQLGSQAVYSEELMNPYLLFLTADQVSKISVRVESNCQNPEMQPILQETLGGLLVYEILSDTSEDIKQHAGSCTHFMYGYLLGAINHEGIQSLLAQGEYIRIIITYDGVDYVYQT